MEEALENYYRVENSKLHKCNNFRLYLTHELHFHNLRKGSLSKFIAMTLILISSILAFAIQAYKRQTVAPIELP